MPHLGRVLLLLVAVSLWADERFDRLMRDILIADAHIDTPGYVVDEGYRLADEHRYYETDIPRLKRGRVGAVMFGVYVQPQDYASSQWLERGLDWIDAVHQEVRANPRDLELARTADDIVRIHAAGRTAALLSVEGGHLIHDSLPLLRNYYRLGVRSMTLTHFKTNNWADSSTDMAKHNGLTAFGREVVAEMNRLGMLVDISHVSDKTFYDALASSRAPVIASHSDMRALCDIPRNMSDDMVRAVARQGGVVFINFSVAYTDAKAAQVFPMLRGPRDYEIAEVLRTHGTDPRRWEMVRAIQAKYRTGLPKVAIDAVLRHIDHAVKIAGADHVGLGSDFDGISGMVPEGLEDVSKYPALVRGLMALGYSDVDIRKVMGGNLVRVLHDAEVTAREMAAEPAVIERQSKVAELQAYPVDGATVAVNPPGFTWTPNEQAARYRVELRRAGKTVLTSEPVSSTVLVPERRLEPGDYTWRVTYLNAAGAVTGCSRTRRFQLPASAPELVMPDVARLRDKLAGVRPRMFLAGDRLARLRERVARGEVPSWARLQATADAALKEPLFPEPKGNPADPTSDKEWLRTFTPGKVASAHLARFALAWRITGRAEYREAARRWMLAIASWDPQGITSHGLKQAIGGVGNDEASMPILERMSFAWDWMGDQLTPAERKLVLASMTERGNQVLRKLEADDFLSHPFNNHSGRVLAFLGEAGLAFLGDIPDAQRWLDYVLRCYLTSYPSWGGDEGGWAQGLSYWSFYVYNLTNFAEALRDVSGTDLFHRPFYRNTGYLPLYFHPPYAPMGGFGDGAYHPPSEVEGLLTRFLAGLFRDPVLQWEADEVLRSAEHNTTQWREWFMEDVISTWRAASPDAAAGTAPTALDGSRLFADIGWASMHSALGDAANDVWVSFKSSRFGSYSHSHADQNTFQMYAYGRALAIDSGYYPSYGTPHDNLWTRQTKAHNGVLVDGRGQPIHRWEAGGTIDEFRREGIITIARGSAAGAYPDTKLEAFDRTLAFVGARQRPVLVVLDSLRNGGAATYDWLLHALNRMDMDERTGSLTIQDGDARLAVKLIAAKPLEFTQTDRFPVPPEAITNTAYVLGKADFPNQWHFTAHTREPAGEMKFLAVMVPYRATEAPPQITETRTGDKVTVRVGGTEVEAWWGAGTAGPEGETRSRLRVTAREGGRESRAVVR